MWERREGSFKIWFLRVRCAFKVAVGVASSSAKSVLTRSSCIFNDLYFKCYFSVDLIIFITRHTLNPYIFSPQTTHAFGLSLLAKIGLINLFVGIGA